jgi:hypothetical protein
MSMNSSSSQKCPQCGAVLQDNALAGLCPNCLMALNLKTGTVFTGDSPGAQPPRRGPEGLVFCVPEANRPSHDESWTE